MPTIAPSSGSVAERAAAGIWESRLGGGSLYFRFTPGNLRFVTAYPATSAIVKREDLLAVTREGLPLDRLCEQLAERDRLVVYFPGANVVAPRPPLLRPHLAEARRHAKERAGTIRRLGLRAVRGSTLVAALFLPALAAAAVLITLGGDAQLAGIALLAVYGFAIAASALIAALRFRSARVGLATFAAFPPTHLTYSAAFLAGLARR
jgi:hypothetical protein